LDFSPLRFQRENLKINWIPFKLQREILLPVQNPPFFIFTTDIIFFADFHHFIIKSTWDFILFSLKKIFFLVEFLNGSRRKFSTRAAEIHWESFFLVEFIIEMISFNLYEKRSNSYGEFNSPTQNQTASM